MNSVECFIGKSGEGRGGEVGGWANTQNKLKNG